MKKIPCRVCGTPTSMLGTKLCDGCWELERNATAIGLFWQTSDGKWHFSPGSIKRDDIHDNGRPIHVAYLGPEAA